MNNNKNMKTIIKIITVFAFVFGFVGCEEYEDYIRDYDYTAVYFGAQNPVRTLVSRTASDHLEFKIGVSLGGLRENKRGYTAEFMVDPELLNTVEGADKFTLLDPDWYTIQNDNNTFVIPAGQFLGDCPVKINKTDFAGAPGSLGKTYALPLKLLKTNADSIRDGKDYTVIVIKYIDEHSGDYYCKGWEAEWNGTDTVPSTVPGKPNQYYSHVDLIRNKIRTLTTLSLTQFDMAGMGRELGNAAVDHLSVKLDAGAVTLETKTGCNAVTDRGSTYNAETATFTLDYIYTKTFEMDNVSYTRNYLVNEVLILRQDVERELRFEVWEP